MARSANRITEKAESTTADNDVIRRRWLFIDIDPDRPAGISSTDCETVNARTVLEDVEALLCSMGWPQPTTAMSGNGWYLLYPIDLPNDGPSQEMVKDVLEALAARFNNHAVHIDTTVGNAARLAGVVGSLKMKGDSITDRPHRRSWLDSVPEQLPLVSEELLAALLVALADEGPKGERPEPGGGPSYRLDLEKALRERDIEYRTQPPDANGITWYHVKKCPFHEDECHPFECGVGQKLPNGPFAGKCFHPEGLNKGWQEWKVALKISFSSNGREPSRGIFSDGNGPKDQPLELRLTDTWNGRRLVQENQEDILWCEVFRQWFVYDGTRYVKDETREVERRAEATVKGLYQHASSLPDKQERQKMAEWAMRCENRNRLVNMVESAKRMVPVHPNELDTDPMLFNVLNGTIKLDSQTLSPHRKEDRLTKRANVTYDPHASCPQWITFLGQIFAGDQELISFVQRLFGYCLIGKVTEQVIVILYGTGANGKSTLLRLIRALTGDYSYHCRPEVFVAKRNDSQGFELVPLAGARVVTASETTSGRRLDEALIKEMTGGEPINCAPKYGDFFTYQPVFKPLLATNHKPEIRGVDEGIWRRIMLLPFAVTIPKQKRDEKLPGKLEQELSGILNWALAGLSAFLTQGLDPPEAVQAATAIYRTDQDVLGSWIDDNCDIGPEVSDEYSVLYRDYVSWCEKNKEEVVSKARFSSSLDERGCVSHRGTKGKRLRLGIARKLGIGDG